MINDTSTTDVIKGPTVKVVNAGLTSGTYAVPSETNRSLAIALPIALIGTSAIVTGLWFYLRKRPSAVPIALSNHWPGRQRYGIHQSPSQRRDRFGNTKAAGGTTVTLWDTRIDTASDGVNVFREEMRRQEAERN